MARPRQVSDDEIRAAVRKGVLELGPQVSLELVASRLGVTPPALFKRFGSRNALLMAALRPPERPRFVEVIEAGPVATQPFETQLHAIIDAHMAFLEESWPCLVALRESGIPKEELKEMMGKGPVMVAVQALTAWLERAGALGLCEVAEPQRVAMAVFGAGHMPVMLRHMQKYLGGSSPSVDGYSAFLARLVSRGVTSSSARPPPARKRPSS